MSDGNFNRSLLPHTQYGSGMRAGKSMARMKAIEAFEEWLRQEGETPGSEAFDTKKEAFRKILEEKLRQI
ncbi:MAG: hypothetical protein IKX93_05475 [Bacteroidaceae bacterium]|nr:hypothetical protein [Bacteroidaceae bacterium]MBR5764052.1 hypothetical protein [Bacteroidaceae bacterium]